MIFNNSSRESNDSVDNDVEESRESSFSITKAVIGFFVLAILGSTCFGVGYAIGHYPALFSNVAAPKASSQPVAVAPAQTGATAQATALPAAQAASTAPVAQSAAVAATTPVPAKTPAKAQQPAAKSAPQPKPAAVKSVALVSHKASAGKIASKGGHSSPAREPDPFSRMVANPNYGMGSAAHQLMVQVAVLQREQDVNVLLDALSKRGYAASANREGDNRIHVELGPFSTRTDASAMREKLLSDGYNAVLR